MRKAQIYSRGPQNTLKWGCIKRRVRGAETWISNLSESRLSTAKLKPQITVSSSKQPDGPLSSTPKGGRCLLPGEVKLKILRGWGWGGLKILGFGENGHMNHETLKPIPPRTRAIRTMCALSVTKAKRWKIVFWKDRSRERYFLLLTCGVAEGEKWLCSITLQCFYQRESPGPAPGSPMESLIQSGIWRQGSQDISTSL